MGQAKRRGSFDVRLRQAIERNNKLRQLFPALADRPEHEVNRVGQHLIKTNMLDEALKKGLEDAKV